MFLFTLLCGLASVNGFTEINLPSIDFSNIQPSTLLSLFHREGILTIANIPQYAEMRQTYLKTATQCIQQHPEASSHFESRLMKDGTERFTLSTIAAPLEDDVLAQYCPSYLTSVNQFSQLIEQVLQQLAHTMKSNSTTEQLIDVLQATQNLDHFHAYAPSNATFHPENIASTLDFHTDAGILIAMTAPQFFDATTLAAIENPDPASGLFVKRADGDIQHPILPSDELVIMIGQGYSAWMNFDETFAPVLHGMSMPQIPTSNKYYRSWFGKMVLPPPSYTLKNMAIPFGSFVEQSRRTLIEENAFFNTLACPRGLRLMESNEACKRKTCAATNATDEDAVSQCNFWCNHHDKNDPIRCEERCTCDAATVDGEICWMLCVAYMPEDQCPTATKTQQCKPKADGTGPDQKIECVTKASSTPSDATALLPVLATVLICLLFSF